MQIWSDRTSLEMNTQRSAKRLFESFKFLKSQTNKQKQKKHGFEIKNLLKRRI